MNRRKNRHYKSKSSPRKSARRNLWPPRTSEQFFALPKDLQELWSRIVQVPSEIRAHGSSLPETSRQFDVSPRTVRTLAAPAFKKKKGRYVVRPYDRLLRIVIIPSRKGLREVALKDSREASLVGQYWSAVEKFLTTGDPSALKRLRRKTIIDENGKRVRLLTNLDELKRQASAGVLHFESLYGRAA